jgi:hypothetical protein
MDEIDDVSDLDPMFASCRRSFLRGGRAMDAVDDVVSLPTDNTTAAVVDNGLAWLVLLARGSEMTGGTKSTCDACGNRGEKLTGGTKSTCEAGVPIESTTADAVRAGAGPSPVTSLQ